MKKVIIPLTLSVLAGLVLMPQSAGAVSTGRSSVSSSSSSRSSSISSTTRGSMTTSRPMTSSSRPSTNSSVSHNYSANNRTYTPKVNNQRVTAPKSISGTYSYKNLNSNANRLNLNGTTRSYVSYAQNPYSHNYYYGNSFNNIWFYYWLFSPTWSDSEQKIASSMGISKATAENLYKNSKHVTIKTSSGTKKTVIVTEKQYNAINIGDKITLDNGQIKKNNEVLKP